MKILLVIEPGANGAFRIMEDLADYLMRGGHAVHLAYSDLRAGERLGRLVERIERQGGRTLNLRVANRPCLDDLRAFFALRSLARAVRPDVIHSHSAKAGALARLLPLAGAGAGRQVYHPHAYVGMRPRRGRFDFFYEFVERVLARWSTTICSSGDEWRHARTRLAVPERRARCVPNGVDLTRFRPATPEERRAARARLGLPAGGLVLGALGRTCEQKDPMTLYRAFGRLARRRDDVTLFHVGCGELDDEIAGFIVTRGLAGRVVRRDYLAEPETFYHAVDGYALTSSYEGFSIALLEALACDLPLVVSEAPGNGDLLAQPLSQLWRAPVGDIGAFASAMEAWAAARSAIPPPPLNHRTVARAHFDQKRCFRQIVRVYRELARAGERCRAPMAVRPIIVR